MKISMLGCRGIPARYGGFETLAEELSVRLAARGHDVRVYCRSRYAREGDVIPTGVRRMVLPALYTKHLETLSHTLLCVLHQCLRPGGIVFLMNNANAVFIPLLRLFRKKVFVHVDGLEWQRQKWGPMARAWHRWSEKLSARWAHGLIGDSRVICDYYEKNNGVRPAYAAYGRIEAPVPDPAGLQKFGLRPREYFLFVGRMEPENHPDLVVDAYRTLAVAECDFPLVMAGWAPYTAAYVQGMRAQGGARIRFLGGVYGEDYRLLLSHCRAFVHASSVGGTHPVLVEAMGAGCVIAASGIAENRETLGDAALFFELTREDLAGKLRMLLSDGVAAGDMARRALARAQERFNWDEVADAYEKIFGG